MLQLSACVSRSFIIFSLLPFRRDVWQEMHYGALLCSFLFLLFTSTRIFFIIMRFVACNYDSRHALFPVHCSLSHTHPLSRQLSPNRFFSASIARNGTHQWLDKGQALTEWKKSGRQMSILERETEACAILSRSFFLLGSLRSFVDHVKMEWKLLQLNQIQFIMRDKARLSWTISSINSFVKKLGRWWERKENWINKEHSTGRTNDTRDILFLSYSLFKSSLSLWWYQSMYCCTFKCCNKKAWKLSVFPLESR